MARASAKPTQTSSKPTETPAPGQNTVAQRNTSAPRSGPTHEQIARRAYEIFLARGGQHGNPEQDWIQAERELKLGR
jgi:hypothetical protein